MEYTLEQKRELANMIAIAMDGTLTVSEIEDSLDHPNMFREFRRIYDAGYRLPVVHVPTVLGSFSSLGEISARTYCTPGVSSCIDIGSSASYGMSSNHVVMERKSTGYAHYEGCRRLQGKEFKAWVNTFKGRIIIVNHGKTSNNHYYVVLKHHPDQHKHFVFHYLNDEETAKLLDGTLTFND